MGSISKEVASELLPFLRLYKDGSVERLLGSPIVPPSHNEPETGVSAKDITISQSPLISARLYLPNNNLTRQKLPVLVYFHGGGFCFVSAFSLNETTFMKRLVSSSQVVAVSIEYRLAPEHPLPVAYQDCWDGLQWVASHSTGHAANQDPWLSDHADFERLYIGGDSAGANIVHNVAMRAGVERLNGGVEILGAFLTHPYFWGSDPIGSEPKEDRESLVPRRVWEFVYPSVPGGIDSPVVNPVVEGAPSLEELGCRRLLISVAEKDLLKERGILYYNAVKGSGWKGEAELIEVEGEGHAFHIDNFEKETALHFIKRLATFIK